MEEFTYPLELEEAEYHFNRSRTPRPIHKRTHDQYPTDPKRINQILWSIIIIFGILIIILGIAIGKDFLSGRWLLLGASLLICFNPIPDRSMVLFLLIVIGLFFFYAFFRLEREVDNVVMVFLFAIIIYALWIAFFPRIRRGGVMGLAFFLIVLDLLGRTRTMSDPELFSEI